MIYLFSVVFPILSILSGIFVLAMVVKFVIEIQRDIRNQNT